MGRTSSTTHRWLFCLALYLQPSPKKFGLVLGKVCFVKRLRLLGAIFGDFGECGYYRDFGEKPHYPHYPLCPHSPLYQPRAKRTTLLSSHFSPFTSLLWALDSSGVAVDLPEAVGKRDGGDAVGDDSQGDKEDNGLEAKAHR